ncbi:hypothetical protein N865_06615 [Intrasporangium oryzae NRRL B-24470]|uniref:NGG1p interacting factor 3 protein, NIF3 n=1 Tax=Intrasporangium oryzae NRRL B-24470 TaxID=1386089 RepID=W9GEF6_9MICO|nr:hypothetical protein [Intrasporangium oryzae]EWT02259.1 hypothetical protein N865_06615 [Intrasporangium oryzae NRRL B-24470]
MTSARPDAPGSEGSRPLAPDASPPGRPTRSSGPLDVLVFYSPVEATETVLAAVFAAGAGAIGDYTECAWLVEGSGRFRPGSGARPAIGQVGELEELPEHRVEVVLPRHRRREVVAALRAAHPYEEPAFHVLETADIDPA